MGDVRSRRLGRGYVVEVLEREHDEYQDELTENTLEDSSSFEDWDP